MKKQIIKMLLIGICMLAAGICYSCKRSMPLTMGEKQEVRLETVEEISSEAESQTLKPPVSYFVHICGEVQAPGVYEMEEGSRIFQVVEAAGGFTEQAATDYLNMAQVVQDGMKIQVPSSEALEQNQIYGPEESEQSGQPQKINLNTATKEQLMTLPGIGAARAEEILRYRQEQGGFETIEDIMKISGIKDAAFQKIKEYITV